jgi:Restriction endonuclease
MSDWEGFERLAERIARDLAPYATVTWNDRLPGHISETDRQIDVSIRWSDGDQQYLTIVQAKDWREPADLVAVGEFASVVEDVGATRGVMVCRSGFTKGAKPYARNKGIRLYNLHDAESQNWRLELTIPLLWVDLHPKVQINCLSHFDAGEALLVNNGLPILSTDSGKTQIDPVSTFERLWNAGAIPRTLGTLHTFPPSAKPVSVLIEDTNGKKLWRPTEFDMVYEVDYRAWLGQFTPAECRGLVDYLQDNAFIVSHLPIGQIPIERDERWAEIDDPKEVVLNVRGTLVTTTGFEVRPGSAKVDGTYMDLIEPDDPSDVDAVADGAGQGGGPVMGHDARHRGVDPPW